MGHYRHLTTTQVSRLIRAGRPWYDSRNKVAHSILSHKGERGSFIVSNRAPHHEGSAIEGIFVSYDDPRLVHRMAFVKPAPKEPFFTGVVYHEDPPRLKTPGDLVRAANEHDYTQPSELNRLRLQPIRRPVGSLKHRPQLLEDLGVQPATPNKAQKGFAQTLNERLNSDRQQPETRIEPEPEPKPGELDLDNPFG